MVPALGQPRGSRRKDYLSRGSAAILAFLVNGVLLYLLAGLGMLRAPEAPTVEPTLVSIIVQPRRLHMDSRPAMSPYLINPAYRPPDTPPNLLIEVPAEAPPPKQSSDPQLGDGSPSPRGITDGPGDGSGIAVTNHVQPLYAGASVTAREHGTVELRVLVDEQRTPSDIRMLHSSGFPRLDESATRAVRRYRFARAFKGSQAVPVWTTVQLQFDLLPMPVPMTVVEFDATVAAQIAEARRKNPGLRQDLPESDAILGQIAANLIEAVSGRPAPQVDPRSSATPVQVLGMWGRVKSVRFVGYTSRGFDSDIPLTESRPAIGSRLSGSSPVRCEIFEVRQAGGISYWLAVVERDGTLLKRLMISVPVEPLSASENTAVPGKAQ